MRATRKDGVRVRVTSSVMAMVGRDMEGKQNRGIAPSAEYGKMVFRGDAASEYASHHVWKYGMKKLGTRAILWMNDFHCARGDEYCQSAEVLSW